MSSDRSPSSSGTVRVWLAALAGGVVGSALSTALVLGVTGGANGPASRDDPASPDLPVARETPAPVPVTAVVQDVAADDAPDTLPDGRTFIEALGDAEAERSQLAATLVALNREIGEINDALGAMNLPQGGPPEPLAGLDPEGGTDSDAPSEAFGAGEGGGRGGIAVEGLVAAGVDPFTADELRRRSDAWQLERLELVDRASREGWEDSDELDRQLDELDGQRPDLRAELGDVAYDRYLFEAGSNNRVGIASIIPGSAADAAGLAPGDVVMRYADERIFATEELQVGTRGGSRGEIVTLEVERDGGPLGLQVPRGPLGVTLRPLRREP